METFETDNLIYKRINPKNTSSSPPLGGRGSKAKDRSLSVTRREIDKKTRLATGRHMGTVKIPVSRASRANKTPAFGAVLNLTGRMLNLWKNRSDIREKLKGLEESVIKKITNFGVRQETVGVLIQILLKIDNLSGAISVNNLYIARVGLEKEKDELLSGKYEKYTYASEYEGMGPPNEDYKFIPGASNEAKITSYKIGLTNHFEYLWGTLKKPLYNDINTIASPQKMLASALDASTGLNTRNALDTDKGLS